MAQSPQGIWTGGRARRWRIAGQRSRFSSRSGGPGAARRINSFYDSSCSFMDALIVSPDFSSTVGSREKHAI